MALVVPNLNLQEQQDSLQAIVRFAEIEDSNKLVTALKNIEMQLSNSFAPVKSTGIFTPSTNGTSNSQESTQERDHNFSR